VSDWNGWNTLIKLCSDLVASKSPWDLDTSLEKLANSVLRLLKPSETVFLFLDRVDRCKKDSRMALLHTLTKALQTAQCTMKTFSVISRLDWHMNSNDLEKVFGELVVTHKDQQERVNDEDDY
jgi:hypothetical protein